MSRFTHGLARFACPLLVLGTLACGGGRHLQSVTVSPATARSQASFTATGVFSMQPSPVQLTSKDVRWCAGAANGTCDGNVNPGAMVDQDGHAECVSGFSGTVTVLAGTASSMMPMPDGGAQLMIFGSAQLTCP